VPRFERAVQPRHGGPDPCHGVEPTGRQVTSSSTSRVLVVLPWMDAAEGAAAGAILDFPGAEGFVRAVAVDDRDTRHAFLVSMLTKGMRRTTSP
jgi:hypothetical protein